MKECSYLEALREGSAHKDAFNSLTSDLKKENPHWGRQSVDDHDPTTKALFMEENTSPYILLNTDGEI